MNNIVSEDGKADFHKYWELFRLPKAWFVLLHNNGRYVLAEGSNGVTQEVSLEELIELKNAINAILEIEQHKE